MAEYIYWRLILLTGLLVGLTLTLICYLVRTRRKLRTLTAIEDGLGECSLCGKEFFGDAASVVSPSHNSDDGLPTVTCWRCKAKAEEVRYIRARRIANEAIETVASALRKYQAERPFPTTNWSKDVKDWRFRLEQLEL